MLLNKLVFRDLSRIEHTHLLTIMHTSRKYQRDAHDMMWYIRASTYSCLLFFPQSSNKVFLIFIKSKYLAEFNKITTISFTIETK